MSGRVLVYGATGYTGRLIVDALSRRAVEVVLGGRSEDALRELGDALALEHRTAQLDDDERLGECLRDVDVMLNAAGPFSRTMRPLASACLEAGVHYLDISAEVESIEGLGGCYARARDKGVMLMPGVGFDVVPSDCLAVHVTRDLPGAARIRIGVAGLELMSRGSARTLVDGLSDSVAVRRGGALTRVPAGTLWRSFDFGSGDTASAAVSWGDVASAWYSTGVPDIEVYFEATPAVTSAVLARRALAPWLRSPGARSLMDASVGWLPPGPDVRTRAAARPVLVAEAENARGDRRTARLMVPEAYTLTAMTASAITERVAAGDYAPGFHTPARLYGADFVLAFDGVTRCDLDPREPDRPWN